VDKVVDAPAGAVLQSYETIENEVIVAPIDAVHQP